MIHTTSDVSLPLTGVGPDTVGSVVAAASLPAWVGLELYLVVAVVVLAGWWYREVRARSGGDGATPPKLPERSSGDHRGNEPIELPAQAAADSGISRQQALGESSAEEAFFTSDGEMPARQCPECERTFPGVFDVCPFDSSQLRRSDTSGQSTGDQLPRRYCSACGRRYELNASYCYHDGHKLHRDTDRAAADAPRFHVCRSCGFDTPDPDQETCPRDGEQLVEIDPVERRRVKPAFPYNRCRRCGHVAAPGETECPVDGSLLLPAISARMSALPPTGHGERRRICRECGTQFGDQCSHCSVDGTELVELN